MAATSLTARLAAALVLSGGLFDLPSLYVPGIALALLAATCWAWVELAARGATVERLPAPRRVIEGDVHTIGFRVARGPLPLPGGELRDPALAVAAPIGARARERLELEIGFPRRGRLRLERPTLSLRDPLGMRSREIAGSGEGELLVLPRVEPVRWRGGAAGGAETAGAREWDGEGHRLELHSPEPEIDGLRPYRDGSPASRIHWPTVARRGELIERRLVSDDRGTLVVLDAGGSPDRESLDRAVRAAASLCFELAQGGGCSLVLPGERRPLRIDRELRTWPEAHAALAVVEPGGAAAPAPPTARSGISFWVGASAPSAEAAAAATYLVVPGALAGLRVVFTVAGCSGHRAGAAARAAVASAGRAA